MGKFNSVCGLEEQLDRHNDFYAISKTCGKLFSPQLISGAHGAPAEFQKSDLSLSVLGGTLPHLFATRSATPRAAGNR